MRVIAGRMMALMVLILIVTPGCQRGIGSTATRLDAGTLAALDGVIEDAIARELAPGAVCIVGTADGVLYRKAFGRAAVEPEAEPMREDHLFDMASLTKVVATTSAIMKLVEQGRLTLDTRVSEFWPEFAAQDKQSVTVRQLMTHTSGLPAGLGLYGRFAEVNRGHRPGAADWQDVMAGVAEQVAAVSLREQPGTRFIYSDVGYITLGEIVRRVDGRPLHQFVAEEIFGPLGMTETGFLPGAELQARAVPTELRHDRWLRGEVHDPSSWAMGGVAGHAGLFSTADDMARFCAMLLGQGRLGRARVLSPAAVRAMTSPASPEGLPVRGLGWDLDSPYTRRGDLFGEGSFGHTGWTGTSMWVDPEAGVFVVLLTNRVHPAGKGNVGGLQRRVSNIVAASWNGPGRLSAQSGPPRPKAVAAPAASQTAAGPAVKALEFAEVLSGLDVLELEDYAPLAGRRVGLITNSTGVNRRRETAIDLLYEQHQAKRFELVALFSPEHGIRAELDTTVPDERDEATGLPIYSLYRPGTRAPTDAMLEGIDTLVFDIQDIGVRYYTYISTMAQAMETAAAKGLRFVVLDRPNPIGGEAVDGPLLDPELRHFISWFEVPTRHGMTIGELARFYNGTKSLGCELHVVAMRGWRRGMWFDQTGLPWVNPSPNIRSQTEATLYAAVGPIEAARLSVGRGTDHPFERLGAPWIEDDVELAALLNARGLPGLSFIPVQFVPTTREYQGELCRGVMVQLLDRDRMEGIRTAVTILDVLTRRYGAEALNPAATAPMFGTRKVPADVVAGRNVDEIVAGWRADVERFRAERAPYLLYE